MAFLDIPKVYLKGISACVPRTNESVSSIYKWGGVEDFIATTGIRSRRIAPAEVTTSDLCFQAAERLIGQLGWDKSSVDALIFVTQTPDYILPATSCVLQERLGLSNSCFTLDISLGCSGWVYGLSVLAALMQTGSIRRGLLLAGDTCSKTGSKEDKSVYPLFGDAGTATALEFSPDAPGFKFLMNTDGSGFDDIIIPCGGFRNPVDDKSLQIEEIEPGVCRSPLHCSLNGMNVFSFGITKVPKSIRQLCANFNIDIESADIVSFHQANMMMNEMIRKKLKLPAEKVPYCMDEFGNTSSASIPLALVTRCRQKLTSGKVNHLACGFGVGLSWGSVAFATDHIVVPELVEL